MIESQLPAHLHDGRVAGAFDFEECAEVRKFVELDPAVGELPGFAAFLEEEGEGEAYSVEKGGGGVGVVDRDFDFFAALERAGLAWPLVGDDVRSAA